VKQKTKGKIICKVKGKVNKLNSRCFYLLGIMYRNVTCLRNSIVLTLLKKIKQLPKTSFFPTPKLTELAHMILCVIVKPM